MNTQTVSQRVPIIPLLILFGSFALLLFALLNTSPSIPQRIDVQNVSRLHEVLRLDSGVTGIPPRQLVLSADAKHLIVTNGYRNELWDLARGIEQIANLEQSGGYTPVVFFRNTQAVAAFMDWSYHLRFIDMTGNAKLVHIDKMSSFDFQYQWALSPDANWLLTSPNEHSLTVTDLETGQPRFTIAAPDNYVFRWVNPTISTDKKTIATSLQSSNGQLSQDIFLWDARTGALVKKLGHYGDGGLVYGFAFSHDSRWLVVGGNVDQNGTSSSFFQLWDIPAATVRATWKGTSVAILDQLIFSPDDKYFVAGGSGQIWLWNIDEFINGGTPLLYDDESAATFTLNPSGTLLSVGTTTGAIQLIEIKTGKQLFTLNGHVDRVSCLAFGQDGGLLVSSANDNTVRFWSINEDNPYPALSQPQVGHTLPAPVMTPTVAGT